MKGKIIRTVLATLIYTTVFAQTDTLPIRNKVVTADSLNIQMIEDQQPSSSDIYNFKPFVDIPLTVTGVGWSIYAFTKIYNKDTSTAAQILALNRNNIASYNRWGTKYYNPDDFTRSNYFFYGSMPLPFLFLLDKKVRKDFFKVTSLYLEAMGITGILYTGSVYVHDKYRPYAYNSNVPLSKRKRGGAKNSFYAGHVALVGTSTFFMAKVYADYHPDSKLKWIFYTGAGLATVATGYYRSRAGEHFLSDILIGIVQGTLTGILVPQLHKNKVIKNPNLSLVPYIGKEKGFALTYKFK